MGDDGDLLDSPNPVLVSAGELVVSKRIAKDKYRMDVFDVICVCVLTVVVVVVTGGLYLTWMPFFKKGSRYDASVQRGIQRMKFAGKALAYPPLIYALPNNAETSLYAHEDKRYGGKATIRLIRNFLNSDECYMIVNGVGDRWSKSEVMRIDRKEGEDPSRIDANVRTSSTFRAPDKGIFKKIKKKVAAYMDVDIGRIERLQVVRYYAGEKFEPHVDYFDVPNVGVIPETGFALGFRERLGERCYSDSAIRNIVEEGGQRVYTMFAYLNDSDGVTNFPCLKASYRPSKGDAILFCSFDHKGNLNPYVKHEGCPPSAVWSPKYGLNIWIREYSPSANLKRLL